MSPLVVPDLELQREDSRTRQEGRPGPEMSTKSLLSVSTNCFALNGGWSNTCPMPPSFFSIVGHKDDDDDGVGMPSRGISILGHRFMTTSKPAAFALAAPSS